MGDTADTTTPPPSLGWLLLGLSGRALVLQARGIDDPEARPPRATLTPTHLLLPDEAQRGRTGWAAVAHAAAHLRHSTPAQPAGKLKPMSLAVISAIEDARVERLMVREFPGLRRWFTDALRSSLQADRLSCEALVSRMDLALMDAAYVDDNHWVNKARQMFEAQAAIALDDYAAFRRIGSLLANDLGQLRVPFRAELYRVPAIHRDDNSFLWTYDEQRAQAQPEIELAASPPPPPRPRNDAGAGEDTEPGQAIELARWSCPEWDYRAGVLRRDWCTVIDKRPAWRVEGEASGTAAVLRSAAPLRLVHARRLSRAHRLRRQREGDDLDLNAAVDVMVARRARLPVDARLFMRAASELRTCSVLVLLDMSESTNDCPAAGGPRLIDIEKQAALLLARALAGSADRIAIHGFASNTRAEVSNYRLLEFGAPLDERAAALIASAPARHSTRMGAALRHATQSLAAESSAQRIVLMVTDGAPSDIDVHAPDYLVEDARRAVQQARQAGIAVHGLAIEARTSRSADPDADAYVRRIFGWGHFDIVETPQTLPGTLCRLYARLSAA